MEQLGNAFIRPSIIRRTNLPRAEIAANIVRRIQAEEKDKEASTSEPQAKKKKLCERKRCKVCPPSYALLGIW